MLEIFTPFGQPWGWYEAHFWEFHKSQFEVVQWPKHTLFFPGGQRQMLNLKLVFKELDYAI